MKETIQREATMDSLKRCPGCFQAPEIKFEDSANGYKVTLTCHIHGHMAIGDTLEKAKENWNTYVSLLQRVA